MGLVLVLTPDYYRTDEPQLDKTAKTGGCRFYGYPKFNMKGRVSAMSYEVGVATIIRLHGPYQGIHFRKAGGGINVRFSTDPEKGKHYANCSDGTTIIGNEACLRVSVRWGSGHQSIAAI